MTAGDGPGELRRWKIIALTSAFVAVAAVAGLIGWIARGPGEPTPPPVATFTGGGWTISGECSGSAGGWFTVGDPIKILTTEGTELAAGKILTSPGPPDTGCRQTYAIDGIPGGRGVYVIEVGHWRQTVTEVQLRANQAEISVYS
ncbi:MAG: hypothetical protein HOV77_05775 [Hamadaea sp.]|uniref:hypothetical protein n=1 Tax=Hamadaea sp. TaxID=2024425 RepID=UPI00185B355E|nr:hypothetical protein [Hamadaea sp.]NUT18673.1 hypothetical protein [Hamadaea sp.]